MRQIQVLPAREKSMLWEVPVTLGSNESSGVGFLLTVEKEHWRELTKGTCSPERLARLTFEFLLQKKKSPFLIDRQLHTEKLKREFPDYEEAIKRKIVGAFGA